MATLVERMHLVSKVKTPYRAIVGLSFLLAGASFGYYKAKLQATYNNDSYSQQHLKQYISEDQINNAIDKSNKPAVVYYYQPAALYHYIIRHGFIRCSNICHQKADFYLVNLTKKLQKAIPQLQHKFPLNEYLLEIRFPKEKCQVVYTNGDSAEKQVYRRQFFNFTYMDSGGVENFLQQNGILKQKDTIQDFFNLNRRCLFEQIPQDKPEVKSKQNQV